MRSTGIRTMTIRRISDDSPIAEVYINEGDEVGIASQEVYIEELAPSEDTFEDAQRRAIDAVNLYAAHLRSKYMSIGHGIEIIYMRKDMEAQHYTSAGSPDLADGSTYPFIWAEAQALNMTSQEVATRILERTAALTAIGSQMEGTRMAGMAKLEAATTMEELAAAKLIALTGLSVYA